MPVMGCGRVVPLASHVTGWTFDRETLAIRPHRGRVSRVGVGMVECSRFFMSRADCRFGLEKEIISRAVGAFMNMGHSMTDDYRDQAYLIYLDNGGEVARNVWNEVWNDLRLRA